MPRNPRMYLYKVSLRKISELISINRERVRKIYNSK